ncbi:ParB N-terminal domain-containing protein [Bacillus sp. JJ1503]|uniref:ParB/RepB/Spo0J family partition protein n=1 Tax=Bacillus sp. JJ1503 TaxID=3122956 RepID=UPI0030002964
MASSQLTEHSLQSELSPMMNDKAWRKFLAGIVTKGILQPIVATRGFRVIDGKHRLRAAKELGIESVRVVFEDISEDKIAEYITETKLSRDDLKSGQKSAIVIRLFYEEERQEARKRQLSTLVQNADTEIFQERDVSGEAAQILADRVGVSARYMYQLLAVYKSRLDLFQLVFDGKYSINRAYSQMKKDEAPEVVELKESSITSEKLNRIAEESEAIASKVVVTDDDLESLSPMSILRNKASNRLPQFTREFVHDFELLSEADEDTVIAYNKQIHSVAEGALLLLEAFETDAKKRLFFEFVTKTFLLSKDEKKLNKFLETMGGILNEEE